MRTQYVVQLADGSYHRDRNRTPRHFLHNATKMTNTQAQRIAVATGGKVQPVPTGTVKLGE